MNILAMVQMVNMMMKVFIKSIPFSFYVYKNSYGHKYAYNNGYHYIFK